MSRFRAFSFVAVWLSLPLLAQETQCPSPPELQRLLTQEVVLRIPALRAAIGENRARVVRVTCEVRNKESQRAEVVAHVVNYGDGSALEMTFAGGSLERAEIVHLRGRAQSSPEEREEARNIIRERVKVDEHGVIEGGFVVDPPPGSPPGRYLEFHVTDPHRRVIQREVIVNLSRRDIAAQRNS
jgi:hypothetical protein